MTKFGSLDKKSKRVLLHELLNTYTEIITDSQGMGHWVESRVSMSI